MRGLGSGHVTCGPMRGLEKNCTRWHGQTDRQTNRQTGGYGDSMTESAQWADSVKNPRVYEPRAATTEDDIRIESQRIEVLRVCKDLMQDPTKGEAQPPFGHASWFLPHVRNAVFSQNCCDFKTRTAGGAHQTHKTEDTRHTNGDNSIEKRDSPVERSRRKRPSCGLRGCRRNPEKARRGAPSDQGWAGGDWGLRRCPYRTQWRPRRHGRRRTRGRCGVGGGHRGR